jgi:hypothetical protein
MRTAEVPAAKAFVRNNPRNIPKGDGSLCFLLYTWHPQANPN